MLNQKELIEKVKNYNRFLNPETLSKAYTFAVMAHKNQSGGGVVYFAKQQLETFLTWWDNWDGKSD